MDGLFLPLPFLLFFLVGGVHSSSAAPVSSTEVSGIALRTGTSAVGSTVGSTVVDSTGIGAPVVSSTSSELSGTGVSTVIDS